MNIAVIAPQKFDLQDIACVEMMLRFWDVGRQFLVEPAGGEDGQLIISTGTTSSLLEIQVKGTESAVGLGLVATCLAHTPTRSVGNTLLERLIAAPDRLAILVMSGRCDDGTAPFVVDYGWAGEPHAEGQITRAHTEALLRAFETADIPGKPHSALRTKRQAHNANFARTADPALVQSALNRLIILERLDEAELESRCAERLTKMHRIPSDRVDDVVRRLRSAVKAAKKTPRDALPLIREAVAVAAPAPLQPSSYVDRGSEKGYVERLSRDRVLLVSGTPRVGKSFAARRVAAEFGGYGYALQEFSDVEAAERFLMETSPALRLALLDDPLGGTHVDADATRTLDRIDRLIRRLPPNRLLVVAQGAEPLLATARAEKLDTVVTAGKRWIDLSFLDPLFLSALWDSLCEDFTVSAQLAAFVREHLKSGTLNLEPGCLEYLAANQDRVSTPLVVDEVIRIARTDASALGRALAEEGHERLLTRLSLTTTASEPVGFRELAFIGGAGGGLLPSRAEKQWMSVTIGGQPTPVPSIPNYEQPPELTSPERDALEILERRRLLSINAEPAVGFIHPFYRAAAECLLDNATQNLAASAVQAMERGLFCLSPTASRATARNLGWVFEKLASRPDAQSALLNRAVDGLRSIYPATRDLCFRFLVGNLNKLPSEMRSDLPAWVSAVTFAGLEDIEWTNGQAYIVYGERSGTDYFARRLSQIDRPEVATELSLLGEGNSYLSSERAARVLRFLKREPTEMTAAMVGRLLSYDEAAIRAEGIRTWLTVSRMDDEIILQRIFADFHPSCAVAAYKGVLHGWYKFAPDRQTRLLDGLINIADDPAAAAALMDRLVLFDRVEQTGNAPPWHIFECLLPIVLRVLPPNATFIDARLFGVAQSALAALPAASIVSFCDHWIDWLMRNEQEGLLPGDFALGVTDILLPATAALPELRAGRVVRLLSFSGTGATVRFIADLVDHWEILTADERLALLQTLCATRSDRAWLQATALTREETPKAVQTAVLGHGLSLSAGAEALVTGMTPELLGAAVHVYTGTPPILYYLGVHHSGKAVWEPVLEFLARMPDHPLFEVAFEEAMSDGDGPRVAGIISDIGVSHAEEILASLLRQKVRCTGWFMPEAWSALLSLAPDAETHGHWLDRMASAAPAILDDLSDMSEWLSEDRDWEPMYERLKGDYMLFEYSKLCADIVFNPPDGVDAADAAELQEMVRRIVSLFIEHRRPVLYGTCDLIASEFRDVDVPDLQTALRARREAIFTEMEQIKASMPQRQWPTPGWIDP